MPMKARDLDPQLIHHRFSQTPFNGHAIEQPVLIETAHHHEPVNHSSATVERQLAISLASN